MPAPYLHALACSKCGAALSAVPGQEILTCQYCGQTHVFHAAPPAEVTRRTPGASSALVLWAVVAGLLVLGSSAFVALWSRAESPVAAQSVGPGDPNARYQAGQAVDIHYGATWYAGRVLQVQGARYEISYDGWSSHWNEWVSADRLRARTPTRAAEAPKPVATGTYAVGNPVQIEWNGTWYPGRILEVSGGRYKITYDGYGSSWDEWVETSRLRRPQ